MRLILPYLVEGHIYSDAMAMAGMRHSDSLDKAENEARELLSRIPNLQKNDLRQPVVEKVLNQLINIINAIIEHPEYGRPDEIRVELARALQQSRDAKI
jgi:CRISPR-associated endonuclease Csn1